MINRRFRTKMRSCAWQATATRRETACSRAQCAARGTRSVLRGNDTLALDTMPYCRSPKSVAVMSFIWLEKYRCLYNTYFIIFLLRVIIYINLFSMKYMTYKKIFLKRENFYCYCDLQYVIKSNKQYVNFWLNDFIF